MHWTLGNIIFDILEPPALQINTQVEYTSNKKVWAHTPNPIFSLNCSLNWTSLLDVLGRPYMTSCKVFKSILTENTDLYLGYVINDDALPQPLVFIDDLSRKRLLNPEKLPRTSLWDVLQHIWQNFKQNYVYKSPKHIELFTIQPSMCHTGHISRNKRNHWVLKKFPRTPLWDVLEQILWQFKINWRHHISQKH